MDRRSLITAAALAGSALVVPAMADAQGTASILDRYAAALGAHDMVAFADLFAEDYTNHQVSAATGPPPPGAPAMSPKRGSVAFFAARLAGMPDLKVTIEAAVITADKVAASFVYTGTHGGPYFGIAPTGRPLRFTSCDIFRIQNGKLAEHWGMGDIAGIMAQLKAPAT
jgi:predicted SnoaL-like aldol condensation-catalyzing enzyme